MWLHVCKCIYDSAKQKENENTGKETINNHAAHITPHPISMQMSAKQNVPHETWLKNGKLKMTKKHSSNQGDRPSNPSSSWALYQHIQHGFHDFFCVFFGCLVVWLFFSSAHCDIVTDASQHRLEVDDFTQFQPCKTMRENEENTIEKKN